MIKKLICFLFDHKWVIPPNPIYSKHCTRCTEAVKNGHTPRSGGTNCGNCGLARNYWQKTPCEPITWPCDICHRVRPDKNICVVSYKIQKLTGAVRNLKYCNDNRQCYEVAMRRAKDGHI